MSKLEEFVERVRQIKRDHPDWEVSFASGFSQFSKSVRLSVEFSFTDRHGHTDSRGLAFCEDSIQEILEIIETAERDLEAAERQAKISGIPWIAAVL